MSQSNGMGSNSSSTNGIIPASAEETQYLKLYCEDLDKYCLTLEEAVEDLLERLEYMDHRLIAIEKELEFDRAEDFENYLDYDSDDLYK